MNSVLPLEGVRLLAPTYDERFDVPLYRSRMSHAFSEDEIERQLVTEALSPYAEALGATLVDDACGDTETYRANEASPDTFALFCSEGLMAERREQIRTGVYDDELIRPQSKPIKDCTPEELRQTPYILASVNEQGGTGKYLIERGRQVRRVLRAIRAGIFGSEDRAYEKREYVPTPGDRYTSYRVVVAPTGEVLAAALIYSAHAKSARPSKRIRQSEYEMLGMRMAYGKQLPATYAFENPHGNYFLDARDVRSNMANGGGCIPLMGEGRRELSAQEKKILGQEGIDPEAPSLPEALRSQGELIARIARLAGGAAVGADYVKHALTGQYPLLEVNCGIGVETLRECWFGGDKSIKDIALQIELGKRMLDSVARSRRLTVRA